ncbi:adenine-specific methyltransferase EcoRI family protein [Succinivibrio sp.]|uniref:adenine-specific methyltransferase EcoRI family protein n=1 Tax=Succinivibrio sp. TaxID=2053619 RepID=UPI0038678917
MQKNGKIFTLTRRNRRVDYNDLEWKYLEGDGDFISDEVKKLRDEADFIITNPPFSLFREFISWLFEADKKFVIIGNKNSITYKEVFPLIKENKMWSGRTEWSGGLWFGTIDKNDVDKVIDNKNYKNVSSIWFTNIDHGRRHKPLELMSMADNIKFNKKIKECPYPKYDNYDAIEVCVTNGIPSDYDGVMGVPISFLDKYCPEQFEIVGGSMAYETTACHIMKDYVDLGYKFVKADGVAISGSGALKDKMSPKIMGKGTKDYSISPSGDYLHAV